MAKPILVANWKNYPGSLSEALSLLKGLSKRRGLYRKTFLFIAPPAPYFGAVGEKARGFAKLASQDITLMPKETATGEISPEILKSFGVRAVILGHSERRALGESVKDVSHKVRISLRGGFVPIICIGEKERDTDGEHFEILRDEIKTILSGLSKKDVAKISLAYEPAWAIGKSARDAIDPNDLAQTIIYIRKVLADLFGRSVADKAALLYGGAVEPGNAWALMKNSGIRGFLVGHSSLRTHKFEQIARALIEMK